MNNNNNTNTNTNTNHNINPSPTMKNNIDDDQKALLYAEKYGIIEYEVNNGFMTYKETFSDGTYLCTLNLSTMKEKRTLQKRC